jgi:kynurenine formamidase
MRLERGVVATGTDTESYEAEPVPDPGPTGDSRPVQRQLRIQDAGHSVESPDLEDLARERVNESLFVALPVRICGATGSMVDPVAVH